ncbi:hypothetical protein B566_EDAN007613 [Ephemera danica]|nr:hypothetical protein B566_EDAN007613 [Ephemera danica]
MSDVRGAVSPSSLEFSVEPADTVVLPGAPAMLHCGLRSTAYPAPHITWRGPDGSDLSFIGDTLRRQTSNGSLSFISVSPDFPGLQGSYQCVVWLDGQVGPHVTTQPKSLTLFPGQSAHLTCGVTSSPLARITWLKNDQPLVMDETRMLQLPSGSLDIDEVHPSDGGTYRCNATSLNRHALSDKATIFVDQDEEASANIKAPVFTARPQSTVAIEGSTVTLDCSAIGNPKPWITWLKDGVTIDMADLDSRFLRIGTGSLQISRLQLRDGGTYQCRAENREDSVDATVDLEVQVPPRFIKRPVDQFAVEKEDLELQCEVVGHPEPKVIWLKNGEAIKQNEYMTVVNGNNLRILGLMALDAGVFQCAAKNAAGTIQASARLSVLQPGTRPEPSVLFLPSPEPSTSTLSPLSSGELPPVLEVPTEPLSVTAAFTASRFVTLKWRQPAHTHGTILGYSVFYRQEGSDRERVANTSRPELNVSGLQPSRAYQFRVAALNAQGLGTSSTPLVAYTQAEAHVPGAPRSLRVIPTSATSLFAQWEPPESGQAPVSFYKMFYMEGDSSDEHVVETYNTSYEVKDLHKFAEYAVWVVAFSPNNEPGASTDQVIVRTLSAMPDEAPQNVTLEAASSQSIIVRWEPPPVSKQNGIITGYKIRYKRKGRRQGDSMSAAGNRRMFVIPDLERGTEYQVRLWALNANGTSPPTEWISVLTLDSDLDESQVPDPPQALRARPTVNAITVTWAPAPAKSIMVRGYTIGWGKGIPDVYTQVVEGKQRYYTIEGLEPNSEYVISLRAYNEVGDGAPVYETVRTREESAPEVYTPLIPPVGLEAVVLSSSSVVVYWTDTTLSKNQVVTDGRHYVVRYTSMHHLTNPRYKYVNATDLNCVIDELKPNTQYEFTVKVVKNRRESPWSMVVLNITQETAPTSPPRDLTIVSADDSATIVNLNWQPPKQPNGQITGYIISYSTDQTVKDSVWQFEAVLGDRLTTALKGLTPDTTYYFRIQARNNKGYGPVSEIETFTTPARNGAYVSESGRDGRVGLADSSLLYLMAAVAGLLVLTVASGAVAVYCCRQRQDQNSPDRNKKGYTKSGLKGKTNIKPPDLWIHHDQMELKALEQKSAQGGSSSSQDPLDQDTPASGEHPQPTTPRPTTGSMDKRTYVPSYMSQGGGGSGSDELRTSTARRTKPVSIHMDATVLHMDMMLQKEEPNSEYVISLRAYNEVGDGAPVYETVRTREESAPEVYTPLIPPVGLEAVVLSSSSVVVYWTDTTLSKNQVVTDGRHYVVRYTSMHHLTNPRYKYVNATDLNCVIDELKPNTQYEFTVKVVKNRRESPWSMVVLNITQETAPTSPPRDLTIVSADDSATIVNLNWQPPKQPNGQITGYIISYSTDQTVKDSVWQFEAVLGDRLTTALKGLTPDTTYYFRIQARNNKGYGPVSEIETFTTPARNGAYVSESGRDGRVGLADSSLLYLMAAVAGLLVLTVASGAVAVYCCRQRQDQNSPDRNKKGYTKSGLKGKTNIKPPDLWIHHDQMELKALEQKSAQGGSSSSQDPLDQDTPASGEHPQPTTPRPTTGSMDKRTYVPSYMSQGGGGSGSDELRTSTARRTKPVSIHMDATVLHMDMMLQKEASPLVSASTADSRPPYPRTQYSVSRAHVTLDPGSSTVAGSPYKKIPSSSTSMTAAQLPPGMSSLKRGSDAGRGTSSTTPLLTPSWAGSGGSPYKKIPSSSTSMTAAQLPPGMSSLKRGSDAGRGTSSTTPLLTPSWAGSGGDQPTETTKLQVAPSYSTEELNQEMANLDCLMKDLNAITASEFEC